MITSFIWYTEPYKTKNKFENIFVTQLKWLEIVYWWINNDFITVFSIDHRDYELKIDLKHLKQVILLDERKLIELHWK